MTQIIAVAGKGGTGKTTVAALLVRELVSRGLGPVLVIDADANDNMADALGMTRPGSIAEVTDDFFGERISLPAGMTKEAYLEICLNRVIGEGRGFDLLVMGHSERAGCYCYINNVLRAQLERLVGAYPFAVIDNEAGLEHISRRTARKIDVLLAVADPSQKAVRAAGRIRALAQDLEIAVGQVGLVLNRVRPGGEPDAEIARTGLLVLARIPEGETVRAGDIDGRPVFELPGDDPVVAAVGALLDKIVKTGRPSL